MAPTFHLEQSAYIPGRRIEASILFLDLLGPLLRLRNQPGSSIFLDTIKAFDTVSRQFLFDVMSICGCSLGMINFAKIILSHTFASTHANGISSPSLQWSEGVRQGCPLSPLLYNFIPLAFSAWLRTFPSLGITLDLIRHISTLHADDHTVHLPLLSPSAELDFSLAANTFKDASNQAINFGKSNTQTHHNPSPSPPPLSPFAGIPSTDSLVSLGVPRKVDNSPSPSSTPHSHFTRQSLHPQILPTAPIIPPSTTWTKIVDTAQSRLSILKRLSGAFSPMGLGIACSTYSLSQVLYLAEFSDCPTSPNPLTFLQASANHIVMSRPSPAPPLSIPPCFLHASPSLGGFGLLNLTHHIVARHASLATRLLSHLLTNDSAPIPPWVSLASQTLSIICPYIHPAQTLLLATTLHQHRHALLQGILVVPGLRQHHPIPPGPLRCIFLALCDLGPLLPAPSNPESPTTHPPHPCSLSTPLPSDILMPYLQSLSWVNPKSRPHRPLPPLLPSTPLPVKSLYAKLSIPEAELRHKHHSAFALLAMSPLRPSTPPTADLSKALKKAWKLPCNNNLKTAFWLLTSNCIPGGRIPHPQWSCPCSPATSPSCSRLHSFWECWVAMSIRSTLESALSLSALPRFNLWLIVPPTPTIDSEVWTLVCLAAISAMDYGRARLWSAASDFSSSNCIAHFWHTLQSFASSSQHLHWTLPATHPFLCTIDGILQVNAPLPPTTITMT